MRPNQEEDDLFERSPLEWLAFIVFSMATVIALFVIMHAIYHGLIYYLKCMIN